MCDGMGKMSNISSHEQIIELLHARLSSLVLRLFCIMETSLLALFFSLRKIIFIVESILSPFFFEAMILINVF